MYETYLGYIIAYKKKKEISLAFFYIAIFLYIISMIYIYAEIVMKFWTKTVQSA